MESQTSKLKDKISMSKLEKTNICFQSRDLWRGWGSEFTTNLSQMLTGADCITLTIGELTAMLIIRRIMERNNLSWNQHQYSKPLGSIHPKDFHFLLLHAPSNAWYGP